MEQDREKVLELLSSFRADYEDYFVPIGTVDKSTEGKKEVSGLANMFADNQLNSSSTFSLSCSKTYAPVQLI